ncbi:MAG: MiaB/RimO family radical SAM methylthiotransferase [Candidatus Eisenbacteria bacterium]|nr:MiaB/RimO family radical SAM methylthiotransferase [Candidatus Eisenbacteria bacterium]
MRVSVATFGCKVNQCDSEEFELLLSRQGVEVVGLEDGLDFVIVNGCAVTERANSEVRRFVGRMLREFPGARPVLAGCTARLDSQTVPGGEKTLVLRRKEDLLDCLGLAAGDRISPRQIDSHRRTRVFVKVQEGCSERCSFCVVPSVRGNSKSVEISDAVDRVAEKVREGAKEVVIVGTDLGDYGRGNLVTTNLSELLQRIWDLPGEFRVRLGSIESRHLDRELVRLFASSKKLCRHFHVPVQSGDDAVLRMMGRKCLSAEVAARIRELCGAVPDASIGTDVIVGFPGEGEESFLRTVDFLISLPFSYFHVFPFSRRPGTPAFSMKTGIPDGEMRRRASVLRSIGEGKRKSFAGKFSGQRLQVLSIGDSLTDIGLTDNYIRVKLSRKVRQNRFFNVLMEDSGGTPAAKIL